jgi:drug/metabolite transporter (DMT)-like permease
MLALATVGWGLSFPLMKASMLMQEAVAPGHSTWFQSALCLFARLVLAALLMALVLRRGLCDITRAEWRQGAWLASFGGVALLLQADGLAYTSASNSAFFTQMASIFVPLWLALRRWRAPSWAVVVACVLMTVGVGILAGVDVRTFRIGQLGRGEWETLACAALFAGEILALDVSRFPRNRAAQTAFVMFMLKSAVLALILAFSGGAALHDAARILTHGPVLLLTAVLGVACTFGTFFMMIHWQPRVTPTHAGLVYGTEPMFAAVFSLFLPALLSVFGGMDYANERATLSLAIGGGLIIVANLVMLGHGEPPPRSPDA